MGSTEHRTLSFKHMVTPILHLHSSLICVGTPNFVLLALARALLGFGVLKEVRHKRWCVTVECALLGFGVLSESGEKYGHTTSVCALLMGSEPTTTTTSTTNTPSMPQSINLQVRSGLATRGWNGRN